MSPTPLRTVAICVALATAGPALAGVDELPQDIRDELYNMDAMDPMQPLGDSCPSSDEMGVLTRMGLAAVEPAEGK